MWPTETICRCGFRIDSQIDSQSGEDSGSKVSRIPATSRRVGRLIITGPDRHSPTYACRRYDGVLRELSARGPELMRLVLQGEVAALVNMQSVEAVEVEVKR